ncbi:Pentatricopeptide repeat-containing protein At4g20090 [Linum perenne]
MNKLFRKCHHHLQSPSFLSRLTTISPLSSLSSTTTTETQPIPTLTDGEITKINLLIPRLCTTPNSLPTAIHLITTALLTNPPPNSLSLSIFIHSLTSEPDMAKPMSLLTVLRHNPSAHSYQSPIASMLISSYLKRDRPREALKVYHWMIRPGSLCKVEKSVYGVLVHGFCKLGLAFDSLKVLRDMVGVGLLPGDGLRMMVKRNLLWEARVCEAVELDAALSGCIDGEGFEKVINLLDSLIGNWKE